MTKRKLLCKLNAIKSAQKRVKKREERRESAAKAREARLTKKAISPPDDQPSTSTEAVFDVAPIEEEVLLVSEMPSMSFSTTNDVQTQTDQGDHMRRLLRASEEIRSIDTLFASDIADLLNDVRELHTYARAVLMTPQQIHNFEAKCFAVHSYFRTLWESHPTELETDNASGFTPKLHWLLAHAPDFAKRWGWFGWLSEQSVEHLHHVLNKQGERFRHFKGDELLLKIGQHQTLLNAVFDRHLGW